MGHSAIEIKQCIQFSACISAANLALGSSAKNARLHSMDVRTLSNHSSPFVPFEIPCVVSDLPDPEEYFGWISQAHERNYFSNFGPICEQLSEEMIETFGLEEETCIPCANATAGLSAALIAANVSGPVLMPGFTFPATASAIMAAGLEPLVMDVKEGTWAIGAEVLDHVLAETGAKAVILVAPFGIWQDFSAHVDVCRQHGASVIIDNAAGLGVTRISLQRTPDVFEVFSLHATKPLGVGEGGLVFCHQSSATRVRSALNFALTTQNDACGPTWGFNGKLSELHAAVGLAQIRRRDRIIPQRQQFVAEYISLFDGMADFIAPQDPSCAPWQVYPIAMPNAQIADVAQAKAADLGVEFRRYYRPSLSKWRGLKTNGACPVSESLSSRMLALPVRSGTVATTAAGLIEKVQHAIMTAL